MTWALGPKRREGKEGEGRERGKEKTHRKIEVVTKGRKVKELLSPTPKMF